MSAARTLIAALEDAAATSSGYRYLRADGSAADQPYAVLFDAARRVAASLAARGLARRTLVGIVSADPETFLTGFFGISLAGLVPAPLPAPAAISTPDGYLRTLEPTLRVSGARGIVAHGTIAASLRSTPAGRTAFDIWTLDDLLGADVAAPASPSLDEAALVQFTSGSTSDPRGVVITHRALNANVSAIGGPAGLAFSESDRGVSWLPLYHDMGLVGMALSALYFARPTSFLPSLTFLKRPIEWLRAIARERGTVSFAPNFAYDLCVRRVSDAALEGLDLSSWRVAGCGAEPIRAETLEAFAARFEKTGFRAASFTACYGLAEHTLAVTISPPGRGLLVDPVHQDRLSSAGRAEPCAAGDPHAVRIVSCGVSCPGHGIRIVDAEGRPLPDRTVGDIQARGPSIMREYFNAPDATDDVLHDGWLRTGDTGYLAGGELHVCGRRKDMIVAHGRNVYPQDLEWIAGDVPGIRPGRVVAFGTTTGEEPRIVVLVELAGTSADPGQIAADVKRRIADGFGLHVDEVRAVPGGTITFTTSGKPQRARARDLYESGAATRHSG
jgi:acyl-CoA synthetase (AMP-forming)/AMP-acid ligase II